MDADRWSLVKDRFSEALGLPLAERRRFLRHLDDATRSEVVALLEAAEPTSGPLDLPFDLSLLGIDLPGATTPASHGTTALAGTQVGPYLIEEKVGQGGMGDVYRARRADGLFERVVALKLVRADTETVLARFAAERRILGTLEHPGIARLIAAGSETEGPTAGRPWLALEYVDGVPLTEAVRDLGLRDRLRLLAEIAEAVHHAHRRLVVHRDLKPSNVLVVEREDGTRRVKLLDFGIAKIVDPEADPGLTKIDGRSPRTRAYAAPEQVAGQPVTTATDVYGLGLLLFEVLTAARPFPIDQGLHALETAILHDDPPRPSDATQPDTSGLDPKRLHGDLDAICLEALAKEPEARYTSAEAFAADLQRTLDGVPVEARVPSVGYRARRFVARHKAGVAATALVIVALAVGLGVALWQANEAEAARAEAVAALDESETALARAEAVTDFLRGLFTPNDPGVAGGDTLTTMDLMALGVERAEAMENQPEVQAQVFLTIGTTYSRLDRFDEADPLLRRALALRRQVLPPDHLDVATAKHLLAENLFDIYEYGDGGAEHRDEAEALFHEALATRRAQLDAPHLDIVVSLERVAYVLGFEGQYDEAEATFREGLAMLRAMPDQSGDHWSILRNTLTNGLGLALYRQRDYEAAEPVMREALDLYRETYGNEHHYTVTQMTNLGGLLQQTGNYAEAESLAVLGLEMDRRLLGDDHVYVTIDIYNLASILYKKGDIDAAEARFREALDRYRSALGNDHHRVANALTSLGTIHRKRQEFAESEARYLEALSIYRRLYEDDHPSVVRARTSLAGLYTDWGRPAMAARYQETPNS